MSVSCHLISQAHIQGNALGKVSDRKMSQLGSRERVPGLSFGHSLVLRTGAQLSSLLAFLACLLAVTGKLPLLNVLCALHIVSLNNPIWGEEWLRSMNRKDGEGLIPVIILLV